MRGHHAQNHHPGAAWAGGAGNGCSAVDRIENIGATPKMAPVGNPAEQQIVAAIPQPPPVTHAGNSLWQPNAKSFFHDPRANHVGDVITVNVTVADAAKLSNTTSRSRTNSDDANLTNFFGLENALPKSMTPGSLVKMGSDNSNVGNGAINRSEAINMTLAALVALPVLPNGNIGDLGPLQQVLVNNEMRDMQVVSGIVRTRRHHGREYGGPVTDRRSPHQLWRQGQHDQCAAAALWLTALRQNLMPW